MGAARALRDVFVMTIAKSWETTAILTTLYS